MSLFIHIVQPQHFLGFKTLPTLRIFSLLKGDFRKPKNGRASLTMTKIQYATMRILLYAVIRIFETL